MPLEGLRGYRHMQGQDNTCLYVSGQDTETYFKRAVNLLGSLGARKARGLRVPAE